mmetsp:Transcript_184/g.444  ORF Transcript_184/g.444 Transcript_184/m.444 type:complete len:345 (+) Transcript_184:635-1669(+)
MTSPSSNFLSTMRWLSAWTSGTGASWNIGLMAKRPASTGFTCGPKPIAQPGNRPQISCTATVPQSGLSWGPTIASLMAVSRVLANSSSRNLASGYLAKIGTMTWRESFMHCTAVAAVTVAVRLSSRSKIPISPITSFSILPRNWPQDDTSHAPRSKINISSQLTSPSCISTLPGWYQYVDVFMASSATNSCVDSLVSEKKGSCLSASHWVACCSKLMSSLTSINLPNSMSLCFISLWNFLFSQGYFSRIEWKLKREMMATSHFAKERTEAVRRLSTLSKAVSPMMEPSFNLHTYLPPAVTSTTPLNSTYIESPFIPSSMMYRLTGYSLRLQDTMRSRMNSSWVS